MSADAANAAKYRSGAMTRCELVTALRHAGSRELRAWRSRRGRRRRRVDARRYHGDRRLAGRPSAVRQARDHDQDAVITFLQSLVAPVFFQP
jgi:hypothetical protein